MNKPKLQRLILMALCCDLGLFSKRLIAPAANLVTDSLHIPGGVTAAFSLMFLTIAALLLNRRFCATAMAAVQSVLALSFGMVGSMGALSPIGYLMPGLMIDCMLFLLRHVPLRLCERAAIVNALAAVTASLTANWIVFHLHGPVLFLYLCVSLSCGAACGVLGGKLAGRLQNALVINETENTAIMTKKRIILLTALLLGITTAAAAIYLSTRDKVPPHSLLVELPSGDSYTVALDNVPLHHIEGERTNGKGEKIPVEGEGYYLNDVLYDIGYDFFAYHIVLTADDGYSARIDGKETEAWRNAYLLLEEDETLRLLIFSDTDSKRSVSHIVKLSICSND